MVGWMCPEAMGSAMIEPVQHTAMIACEGNNKLLVVHMQSMRVTASDSLGEDGDVLAFDDVLRLLYVASDSESCPCSRNRVYLPLQNANGRPALRVMEPVRPATGS